MKFVRELEIVGGGERLLAKLVERKRAAPMAARGTWTVRPFTTRSCGLARVAPVRRRQASSRAASAAPSAGTYHTGAPASFSSRKSVRACEPHDLHTLLDQRDERQKQRAVEPVLVELARRHVGGRHHHHAELEQAREQPAEDHGIGDIGDVEFVEAQKPASLARSRRRQARIGSSPLISPRFSLLPQRMDALVYIRHELVEMDASLARDR